MVKGQVIRDHQDWKHGGWGQGRGQEKSIREVRGESMMMTWGEGEHGVKKRQIEGKKVVKRCSKKVGEDMGPGEEGVSPWKERLLG